MHPPIFSTEEQEVLRQCVSAIRSLPIFTSNDFEAIFGSSCEDVDEVLRAFPKWDLYDEEPNTYDPSGNVVRTAFLWLLKGSPDERKIMRMKIASDDILLKITCTKVQNL